VSKGRRERKINSIRLPACFISETTVRIGLNFVFEGHPKCSLLILANTPQRNQFVCKSNKRNKRKAKFHRPQNVFEFEICTSYPLEYLKKLRTCRTCSMPHKYPDFAAMEKKSPLSYAKQPRMHSENR
jgi:hypothetical protein